MNDKKIGLAMIVSDRPDELREALTSAVDLYDELRVTIVRFPMVDESKVRECHDIAEQFGAVIDYYSTSPVWQHEFIDDFGAARNQSCKLFSDDIYWCMWLDSDELLTDALALRVAIKELEHTGDTELIYLLMRLDGGFSYQPRIWKKGITGWVGRVHETLAHNVKKDGLPYDLDAILLSRDIALVHNRPVGDTKHLDRNKAIIEDAMIKGEETWRDVYYYGMHLWLEGDKKEACDNFKEALRLTDHPETVYHCKLFVAHYLIDEKKSSEALDLIMEAIHINQIYPKAFYTMGDYFSKEKMYRTALQWYKMAIDLPEFEYGDTNNFGWTINQMEKFGYPLEQMAICHMKMGDVMKARDCHARARWWNPFLEKNDKYYQ